MISEYMENVFLFGLYPWASSLQQIYLHLEYVLVFVPTDKLGKFTTMFSYSNRM